MTGDRIAVVGPSGSGKTLLLRALAMLDPLDEGEIQWRGGAVSGRAVPEFRSCVIYLHQRPALLEGTVEHNLRQPFCLGQHRQREFDEQRMVDMLGQLGRDDSFLEKDERNLSGGEAQLVSLLRAIQLDPTVLLLDEPTAALDEETAQAVERLVDTWLRAAEDERAIVWVSHNQSQSQRVATRWLRVRQGGVENVG